VWSLVRREVGVSLVTREVGVVSDCANRLSFIQVL